MERRWSAWEGGDRGADRAYSDLLWSRGRWSAFVRDEEPIMARPMDVDRHGRLIVEMENGEVGAYGLDRLRFAPR